MPQNTKTIHAMKGKIIIISAPSGCGKSTIINAIMERGNVQLEFSVSATNRNPRQGEEDGVNYYFLTTDDFLEKVAAGEFIEFEEVYPGRFYGTLKSEVSRKIEEGKNVVLDIDVKGGINVKRLFGEDAKTIFIMPPSVAALKERLINRGTDSMEMINQRVEKAEYEISFAKDYDVTVVNDDLDAAILKTEEIIIGFLKTDV
ncbi:MAG: guanylate kinase [Muribaculaceae bacterium]